MDKYEDEINCDLIYRTGCTVQDLGEKLDWKTAYGIITHLDAQSALAKKISPEAAEWSSRAKTNFILADIFDVLSAINYNIRSLCGSNTSQKPRPYPRPGKKDGTQKFGKGAIPVKDIRSWVKSYCKK